MTPSERIRAAALGPTPRGYHAHLWSWVDPHTANTVARDHDLRWFLYSTDTERRMFLLFVAEALESQ